MYVVRKESNYESFINWRNFDKAVESVVYQKKDFFDDGEYVFRTMQEAERFCDRHPWEATVDYGYGNQKTLRLAWYTIYHFHEDAYGDYVYDHIGSQSYPTVEDVRNAILSDEEEESEEDV